MKRVKYLTDVKKIPFLSSEEKKVASKVSERFVFRTTDYYLNLIDWSNPSDPLRRIAIPFSEELQTWGYIDPSKEHLYTVVPGLEHKYKDTALFLVTDICFGYCRFCFRKRLFMKDHDEKLKDYTAAFDYIKEHSEIINVLLTGGDPMILSTTKLRKIIEQLRKIDHVKNIRIGTKMLAYNPYRVLDDPELVEMLKEFSYKDKRIYIVNDINHPREITDATREATDVLLKAGLILINQTPLLRYINDDPQILSDLFKQLSQMGVPPYYVFINRPVVGNSPFAVPIEEAWLIFEKAKTSLSGLERRPKLVMSHWTGKIEILALTSENIIFKYQRAAKPENDGKVLIFKRNPEALWFDDYTEPIETFSLEENKELLQEA